MLVIIHNEIVSVMISTECSHDHYNAFSPNRNKPFGVLAYCFSFKNNIITHSVFPIPDFSCFSKQ